MKFKYKLFILIFLVYFCLTPITSFADDLYDGENYDTIEVTSRIYNKCYSCYKCKACCYF